MPTTVAQQSVSAGPDSKPSMRAAPPSSAPVTDPPPPYSAAPTPRPVQFCLQHYPFKTKKPDEVAVSNVINFEFDKATDNAAAIANEMVDAELLSEKDQKDMSKAIRKLIKKPELQYVSLKLCDDEDEDEEDDDEDVARPYFSKVKQGYAQLSITPVDMTRVAVAPVAAPAAVAVVVAVAVAPAPVPVPVPVPVAAVAPVPAAAAAAAVAPVGVAAPAPAHCAICLGNPNASDTFVSQCNHSFCNKCILQWIARHDECPLCRECISAPTRSPKVLNDVEVENQYKFYLDGNCSPPETNLVHSRVHDFIESFEDVDTNSKYKWKDNKRGSYTTIRHGNYFLDLFFKIHRHKYIARCYIIIGKVTKRSMANQSHKQHVNRKQAHNMPHFRKHNKP